MPVLAVAAGAVFAVGSSAALGVPGVFEPRTTSVRMTTGRAPSTFTAPPPTVPSPTATVEATETSEASVAESPAPTTPRQAPRTTGTRAIDAATLPQSPTHPVGTPPPPLPAPCPPSPPGWRAPGPGLYRLATDGSGAARRIIGDELDAQAISLSPDGSTLSIVSAVPNFNGSDGPFRLYLMDGDGTNQRRIVADLDNPFAARWSPDGRWIAFLNSEPESYTTGLYVTDPTGTTVRRLATAYASGASGGNGLSWSPQSDRIAYSTNQAPAPGVHVVRMSDGAVTKIYPADLGGLSWSPDGSRLAGMMMPAGAVVMSASGEGGTVINQRADSARWSPRADEIATGSLVIAPDGAFVREGGLQRALDWSPDGARVLGNDARGATVIVEERCGKVLIAADGWHTGYATWSSDGATILVYSRSQ